MRPGNPKQHVHNWSMAFTEFSKYTTELPDRFKDYDSPGGFYLRRYWKCVRGNKIKHTWREPEREEPMFLMASGISYSQQVRIN